MLLYIMLMTCVCTMPQIVYAAISGGQLLAQLGNIIDTSRLCLRAADKLHNRLLGSLLTAPMAFFHTTPIGRLV